MQHPEMLAVWGNWQPVHLRCPCCCVLPTVPAHIVCVFEQNHLAVFSVVHPLAPSISSSVASSLASSTGSGSSSPTALPALPARALPLDPAGNTVEAVIGKSTLFFFSTTFHTVLWMFRICCSVKKPEAWFFISQFESLNAVWYSGVQDMWCPPHIMHQRAVSSGPSVPRGCWKMRLVRSGNRNHED